MNLIAQVIVNKTSKQTDKKFDYLIPEEFEEDITVGTRVFVPFGSSNKREEGYVIEVTNTSKAKKLKSVISAEKLPMFSKKTVRLIEWMREKYLCTYIDVIKAIIPTGTAVKSIEFAAAGNTDIPCTKKEREILDIICQNGGETEVASLMQLFEDENIRPYIKKMYDKGILVRHFKDVKNIKDKKARIVSLTITPEDTKERIEFLNKSRAIAQAKVLEVLNSVDIISAADLIAISQCGYNTLTALKKKGLIEFSDVIVERNHIQSSKIKPTKPPVLTTEQEYVCDRIRDDLRQEKFSQVLLHGVTGSGKTEVYMNIISAVINDGKQAIMLVPEIALTPQIMERFISRFGERVAVFHSGLSLGERYDEWKKMRDGIADVVIGARSAVFAPFENIGVIIIDEEHETSYKSETLPRYDTKEVAVFRARQNNCPVVYASATPDIRTYKQAQDKKINLLELKTRINRNPIPNVTVIDMRDELAGGNKSVFSKKLYEEIAINLKNKEQTILLFNRRGFSTFVSCRSCGFVASCPNCNISLTYHKFNNLLKCHYCGYTVNNYTQCPECKSQYIRYFGGGTQKVEEEIKKLFPDTTTLRMDFDTTGRQNSHEKILAEFEEKKTDILIGTQMVAKGLDFPNVTLVGVVSADTMLNIDDYRSGERTFDLLEQVVGRAGRADKKGRAIIQTYSPDHRAVILAASHNYNEFYKNEIALRKAMWYPPYCEIVTVLFSGDYESTVSQCAKFFAKSISELKSSKEKVLILGPVPSEIAKIKNKYRWHILIKCTNSDRISSKLLSAAQDCAKNKNFEKILIVIDKNPNNIY